MQLGTMKHTSYPTSKQCLSRPCVPPFVAHLFWFNPYATFTILAIAQPILSQYASDKCSFILSLRRHRSLNLSLLLIRHSSNLCGLATDTMRYPWITFILLACLRVTFQQEFVKNNLPNTAFTTPGPAGLPNDYNGDKVYLLNAIVDIQWFTNFSFYSVYLWQQAIPGGAATPSQNPIYSESRSNCIYPRY